MFLARDQKCLCLLEDTAGDLSPSAPSPRSGEGWGEAHALWILLATSLRLLPLHAVERAGVRPPPFGFASSILEAGEPGGMLSHEIIDEVKLAAPPVGKSLQQEDGANRT